MIDSVSDKQYKNEILRLIKFAVIKVGENSKEIALLRNGIDKNTKELISLKKEIRSNSGVHNDATFRVLEMFNRLFDVEKKLKTFVNNFTDLDVEHKRINNELVEISQNIDVNPDVNFQLIELNVWLESLEEKVFA
jgi:hypothetical protein